MFETQVSKKWDALSIGLASILLAVPHATADTIEDARITEFLAINDQGIEDGTGDRSDWIEVWNASGTAGDLDGWYLTDDPGNLTKWRVPAVGLDAGERVTVFASAKDLTDPAAELHTNFRLSSIAGGYLALVKPDGVTIATEFAGYPEQYSDISYGLGFGEPTPETFVEEGDAARVLVPTAPLPAWQDIGFDDSAWIPATTGIGFDNAGATYQPLFGIGDDELRTAMRTINASAYIRIPFTVADAAGIEDLVLSARWEDGFVAYLNGVEIHRERAPTTLAWNSRSFPESGRNETEAIALSSYPLTAGSISQGANVLAIQGLNQSEGSSDFLFSPRLTGMQTDVGAASSGFFPEPTPGDANGLRVDGITADTKFSVDRGLYDTPADLVITTDTAGASIRYTTDGSRPDDATGTLYDGPINISETTVVRAIAYRAGFLSTNVDTHTYVFPADVVTQPTMSTTITQDPVYGPQMIDALTAIPTIALSFEGSDIDRTEIPISVELLNFESGAKQVDAGAVRYGSYVTNFEKRSFRLHFRSEYGPSRLEHPLFEETDYVIPPTVNFDSLDVRAGNHDMIDRGAYLSNRFTDDAMIEMGNLSAHGRFVHLYFNGLYHGQYHLRERWDAAMAADYLPGKEEEFDTINANNTGSEFAAPNLQALQDGDLTDWIAMRDLIDNSATPYSAVKDMLDVANLIDFMLLWTMGNSESEFRAAGSIENGVGFKFFIKDADGYLRAPNNNHQVTHNGPLSALTRFRTEGDPDFMTLLADRIHLHFFNDGALTPARNIARLQHRVDEMSLSYLAEAARRAFIVAPNRATPNRTPVQWLAYHQSIINNRFPTLTGSRLSALRAAGMYPDIIAPVLSQHGGSLAPGSGITMSTDVATIYYTLDGSDPRLPGGTINPAALSAPFNPNTPMPEDFISTGDVWRYLDDGSDQGSAWFATNFDDSSWSAGPSELGYGEQDEATVLGSIDTDPVAPGLQRNATTYLRHTASIASPSSFSHFDLDVLYDDGVAVYVNGVEVARTANLPPDAAFDTFTTSSTPSESNYERFTLATSRFTPGDNVIAVELHNQRAGSGDVSFDLRLRGEIEAGNGNNFTLPVVFTDPAAFRARAYVPATGEWSAVTSTFFSLNSTPATVNNLAISEIHYHPAEPTTAAELAVSTDRDDYEFIELLNIGNQPIELEGVHFADGITFAFGAESLLDPGERAVLVRDIAAFEARYGTGITIAGEYSGRLSNSGERISLDLEDVGVLRELVFGDSYPWPAAADGNGVSLVLREPFSNPDHTLPTSWGAHTVSGGAPGSADSVASGFAAWKLANGVLADDEDNDLDGLPALVEYALGTSPSSPDGGAVLQPGLVEIGGELFPTLSFSQNPEASDVDFQIQSSTDLETWTDEQSIEVATGTYRITTPFIDHPTLLIRLRVSLR